MDFTLNGHSVFAATAGRPFDPKSRNCVLLHGAGMDHVVWCAQAMAFSARKRDLLAVNLPGHGRSGGPPLTSIGDMADWLLALLDAAEVEQTTLVGHSMGAAVALEAAARAPDRFRSLALLGVSAELDVNPKILELAAAGDPAATRLIVKWCQVQGKPDEKKGGWGLTETLTSILNETPRSVIHADLKACNEYDGVLTAAAKVSCPVLLVLGEGDRITPAAQAETLAEALPDCEKVTLPDCGHMMMIEAADGTTAALEKFLSEAP